MWICVCGQWIHNGYLLLEKHVVNQGEREESSSFGGKLDSVLL